MLISCRPRRTRLLGQFHTLLAQQHGNAVLTELLIDLLNRSSLIALMYQSSPSAERSHQEHVQLVTALEMHDTGLVQQLMSQHLHNVERHLRFDPRETDLAVVLGSVAQLPTPTHSKPPAKFHQTGQRT